MPVTLNCCTDKVKFQQPIYITSRSQILEISMVLDISHG